MTTHQNRAWFGGQAPNRAVVAKYPPTDLAEAVRTSGLIGLAELVETNYLGGTPATAPAAFRTASPVTYIRPGLPPTLVLHGKGDRLVPWAQATLLDRKLAAAGVPHRTVLLPWTDHGFDLAWGNWPTQISHGVMAQFLAAYTR